MNITSEAELATALYLSLLASDEAMNRDTAPEHCARIVRLQVKHFQETMPGE